MSPLDTIATEIMQSLSFAPGARVLDASCGSGASALAAADAVGPFGCVLAVDCDERLLEATRAEAIRKGIGNVSFHYGGLEDVDEHPETFDTVVCSFANFIAPEVLVRQLWHWVRVDGEMVITTFLEGAIEPAHTAISEALRRVQPTAGELNLWEDHTRHVAGVEKLLSVASAPPTSVKVHARELTMASLDQWWTGIVAPYYRTVLGLLSPAEVEQVRQETLRSLAQGNWQRAKFNFVSATVWKRKSSSGAN